MEKKVNYIPAARSLRQKKVGIYCRVSTNDMEQLHSLTNQISALTRLVSTVDEWKLMDCYVEFVCIVFAFLIFYSSMCNLNKTRLKINTSF